MRLTISFNDGSIEEYVSPGNTLNPAQLSIYQIENITSIVENNGFDDTSDHVIYLESLSSYIDEYGNEQTAGAPCFEQFTNLRYVKLLHLFELNERTFENSTVETVIIPACVAFSAVGGAARPSVGAHFRNAVNLKTLFIPGLDSFSPYGISDPATVFEGCTRLDKVVACFKPGVQQPDVFFEHIGVPSSARYTAPDKTSDMALCAYYDCITAIDSNGGEINYPKQCLAENSRYIASDDIRFICETYIYNEKLSAVFDSVSADVYSGVSGIGPLAFYDRGLTKVYMPYVTEIGASAFIGDDLSVTDAGDHPYGRSDLSSFGQLKIIGSGAFQQYDYHQNIIDLQYFNLFTSGLESAGSYCFSGAQFIDCYSQSLNMPSLTSLGEYAFANCSFAGELDSVNLSSLGVIDSSTFTGGYLETRKLYLNSLLTIDWSHADEHYGNLLQDVILHERDAGDGIYIDELGDLAVMRQYASYDAEHDIWQSPIRNVIMDKRSPAVVAWPQNLKTLPDERYIRLKFAWPESADSMRIKQIPFAMHDIRHLAFPNLENFANIMNSRIETIDFSGRTIQYMPEKSIIDQPDYLSVYVNDTQYDDFINYWSDLSSHIKSAIPLRLKTVDEGGCDYIRNVMVTDSLENTLENVYLTYNYEVATELSFCSMANYEPQPYCRISAPLTGYWEIWDRITDIYFSDQGVDRDFGAVENQSHMFGYLANPVTVHVKGRDDGSLRLQRYYFQYVLPQSDTTLVIDWPYLNGVIDGLYFGSSDDEHPSNILKICAHKCVSINDLHIVDSSKLTNLEIPFVKTINNTIVRASRLSGLFLEGVSDMNLYFTESVNTTTFYGCEIQSLNCRNLSALMGDELLADMSSITDLNFPLLTKTDTTDSGNIINNCSNLSCIWAPLVSTSPQLRNTKIESFRNYSSQFRFKPDSFSEIYTIDGGGTENDSLQFRGVDITALQSFSNLSSAGYPYYGHNIIGTQWSGDTVYNVIYNNIKPQIQSSPNHTPWLHLCLADDAQPYLSGVFLSCGNDSRLSNEYLTYTRLHEFEHASSKHDYSPRHTGSIHDLLDYNKMLTCDLWWFDN